MNTSGTPFLKKLTILLAVLLCGVLPFALPQVSYATSSASETTLADTNNSDASGFILTDCESLLKDSKAILQLDKSLAFILQGIMQLQYPFVKNASGVPAFYTFSKNKNSLNPILTKGP